MKRVIVLGGLGHFGRTAAELLRSRGVAILVASRSQGGDLRIDANDPHSIRSELRAGDIVIDTAGPFRNRSTSLIEAAIEIGLDVVDINDDLVYAESVLGLEPQIRSAGIRILSSASTVSAVAAAVVRQSGIERPRALAAFLAPATRYTANSGAAASLVRCVGRRIRVLCDGELQEFPGWRYPRRFPMPVPVGAVCGRLFESADAVLLPRIWPSLRNVAMYVDANTPGVNLLLDWAARWRCLQRLLDTQLRAGTWFARMVGSSTGGIGYEIEDSDGGVVRCALVGGENSFLTAVAPAILAAQAIFDDRFPDRGLVPPNRHVEPAELLEYLESAGIAHHGID